jgi:hypothetical protein
MTPPKIQALGVTQQWSTTSWKATGYVEDVSWLEVWGTSLIDAMEALQALAAQRTAAREPDGTYPSRERRPSPEKGDETMGPRESLLSDVSRLALRVRMGLDHDPLVSPVGAMGDVVSIRPTLDRFRERLAEGGESDLDAVQRCDQAIEDSLTRLERFFDSLRTGRAVEIEGRNQASSVASDLEKQLEQLRDVARELDEA